MINVIFLYRSEANAPVCRRIADAMIGVRALILPELHPVPEGITPDDTVILRWDSAVEIPGFLSINDADKVALSRDKIKSRVVLGDLAPPTWTQIGEVNTPCILRPRRHSGGRRFHVVEWAGEATRLARRYRRRGWYASPIVDKMEEFRVFVVCGRIAAVSQHFPPADHPDQVAWNVTAGGRMTNVKWDGWNPVVLNAAICGTERLGLDFAAIDICTTKDGQVYIFEANTAPGIANRYTKECVAKALSWSVEKPCTKGLGESWKTLIHPAIRSFDED